VNEHKNNKNNTLLAKLARQDQRDRQNYIGNEARVFKNDQKRRLKVAVLLARGEVRTGTDCLNAALIYQHGSDLRDYLRARTLARKAMAKGEEAGKWLYAAATDRWLVRQDRKQKFGTQYSSVADPVSSHARRKRVIRISPYDKRTSDKSRARFHVPPLSKLLAMQESYTKQFCEEGKGVHSGSATRRDSDESR
jgi:hypothetical protein